MADPRPDRKLTDRERRFVEAWVADPHHNGVEAARAAGYEGKNAVLKVTAHRLLTRAHVKAHADRLRQAAVVEAERVSPGVVLSLAKALVNASAIAEVNPVACYDEHGELSMAKMQALPPDQQKALAIESQHTTDAEGQAFSRYKVKRDPVALAANKLLVEHYEGVRDGGGTTVNLNVTTLPADVLRVLYAHWLRSQPRALAP